MYVTTATTIGSKTWNVPNYIPSVQLDCKTNVKWVITSMYYFRNMCTNLGKYARCQTQRINNLQINNIHMHIKLVNIRFQNSIKTQNNLFALLFINSHTASIHPKHAAKYICNSHDLDFLWRGIEFRLYQINLWHGIYSR